MYLLPNGDVLVTETNIPARPEEAKGIKSWVMGLFMKQAGAATKSANLIALLRDGVADLRSVLLKA
ncbi:Membrane bound L-sorbosone dehydrogenase [compost metagenome]